MKQILLLVAVGMALDAGPKSPLLGTFAYSRATIPGIPDRDTAAASRERILPVSYFIYVVVKKGTPLSADGLWLQGKYYGAVLKKVESPVLIEHDAAVPTGEKDTLVRKTLGDVFQVQPGEEKTWNRKDIAENKLAHDNEVVVFLKSGKSRFYGSVNKIKPLHPAAGM